MEFFLDPFRIGTAPHIIKKPFEDAAGRLHRIIEVVGRGHDAMAKVTGRLNVR
jgi:hypothetical protein